MKLTKQELRELFWYYKGELYWEDSNKRVGFKSNGVWRATIHGKTYPLHRIIFAYHHSDPPSFIHHADGNLDNNCIENLLPGKSTHTGICWREDYKKWKARITYKGKEIFIGHFESKQDAIAARKEMEDKLYMGDKNDKRS